MPRPLGHLALTPEEDAFCPHSDLRLHGGGGVPNVQQGLVSYSCKLLESLTLPLCPLGFPLHFHPVPKAWSLFPAESGQSPRAADFQNNRIFIDFFF